MKICCIQWDKPHLSITFIGQTEERDSPFPHVRLLVLIKDDKYVGCENLMALNAMRSYLNKMRCGMGSQERE